MCKFINSKDFLEKKSKEIQRLKNSIVSSVVQINRYFAEAEEICGSEEEWLEWLEKNNSVQNKIAKEFYEKELISLLAIDKHFTKEILIN